MKLRQLIDRLEDMSFYGRNDNLEVHCVGNDEMIDMDIVDAEYGDECIELKLK